jgi:hypothetical protein
MTKLMHLAAVAAATIPLAAAHGASVAPRTGTEPGDFGMNVFYGVDISGSNAMPLPQKMRVNSTAAYNDFKAALLANNMFADTVSFEESEGYDYLPWDQAAGANLGHPAVDPLVQFQNGVQAQVSSSDAAFPLGGVVRRYNGMGTDPPHDPEGRYPSSGEQYLSSGTDRLRLSFNTPIDSFGFYGIDVGDFGATLFITLANGDVKEFKIPPLSEQGEATGSIMFWGIVANESPFTSITFGSDMAPVTGDTFAFDDFTIGHIIPLPNAFGLGTMGLVCLSGASAFRRRRLG